MKEKVKKDLLELADKEYKEFHSNLCPETNNIVGVRVPKLRNYAKGLIKEKSLEELLQNIDNEFYEEIMLQGMLIGLEKDIAFDDLIRYLHEFVPKIDNWAVCDICCGGLKVIKKYKREMWEFIQEYLNSSEEFEIRFAVVIILDYYIEKEYIDKSIKALNRIKSDKYYVQMAVAWAISICLIKFYEKTCKYLESDKCKLDKFTYNKSIQKAIESYRITKEQKEYLKNLKKE